MKKGFSIQDYLEKNKIELGTIKKEVGSSIYKGGHNDLRKTSYDVNIKDGKFQLDTHKTVFTENGKLIKECFHDENGKPIGVDSYHRPVQKMDETTPGWSKTGWRDMEHKKLMQRVNDIIGVQSDFSRYDNSKIVITIEKYDKNKYDVTFKYEY